MTTVREWEQGYKVNTEPKGHSKQTPSYKSRPIQLSAPTDSDSNLKKILKILCLTRCGVFGPLEITHNTSYLLNTTVYIVLHMIIFSFFPKWFLLQIRKLGYFERISEFKRLRFCIPTVPSAQHACPNLALIMTSSFSHVQASLVQPWFLTLATHLVSQLWLLWNANGSLSVTNLNSPPNPSSPSMAE